MLHKDALPHLLSRCTVRLVVNGGVEFGTGFFVAPGYLLTCAHVVDDAHQNHGRIDASWNGQKYAATIEQITDKTHPDLALLKIAGLSHHPCVYLSSAASLGDDLYTYGYTENYPQGEPATFTYEGQHQGAVDLLKLKLGDVKPGFSGSPLLNLRTGAVCGVMKRTRGEDTLLGGRAVPIARVLETFPEIKPLQEQFHRQDSRWAEALAPQQRQVNGLDQLAPQTEAVSLFLSYHPNKKDTRMFRELLKHLATLRRKGLIDTWYEGKTVPEPGAEPMEQVMQHLMASQIIVLFISPDYIDDDTLYNVHVTTAMARHQKKEATVIPVYLRPIVQSTYDIKATDEWKEMPFGKLQAFPRNFKPIDEWGNKDQAFAEIAREIRVAVEVIKGKQSKP